MLTRILWAIFLFGWLFLFAGAALVWPPLLTLSGLVFMAPLPLAAALEHNERSKS